MNIKEEYKDKRVLITGHTGFKGAWMTYLLSEAGAKVTGYSLESPTYPSLFELCRLDERIDRHVLGDVRDINNLKKIFEFAQPEIVIHMAAQPIVRESYINPVYTYDVNVMGTVNVLECCRLTDSVKSVVNVTTDKVYKNNEWEWGYRENEELNGYDPYSNSKSCSELVTSSYRNSFFTEKDIAVSTVRAGNVIGGGDFAKDRIIPDCVRAVEKKEDIVVRNPYSTRPFQHVLEPVCIYLALAIIQMEDESLADSYNVGPDESDCLKTGELVDLFCDEWAGQGGYKPTWINRSDDGPHEANYLKLDCSKIKKVLGWHPAWRINDTVQKLVEWYVTYLDKGDIDMCMQRQADEFLRRFDLKPVDVI
ncbi:MAG: CDP-glucose 4,6-dehydratase [Lachnospiraceae bacterium]|nr:CDP-glucose 4,6-dehydratase [Lachnospiraceae bacterium]